MFHYNKTQLGIFLGLFFCIVAVVGCSFLFIGDDAEGESRSPAATMFRELLTRGDSGDDWELVSPPPVMSLLDGTEHPGESQPTIAAVMVENHPMSRSQMIGLVQAPIVYETLAEGGITRFLAIFDLQDMTKVGPVRSARPYFVDWAGEYGGGYAHAGGSDEALAQIRTAPVTDVDEGNPLLFRDFNYLKPHNMFLNLADFRQELIAAGQTGGLTEPRFDFSGEIPESAADAPGLSLDFSFPGFFVEYDYDSELGKYKRKHGGIPHRDTLGTRITPTNVVVQFANYWVLPDDEKLRLGFDTQSGGDAWYFTGGKFFRGTWSKAGDYEPTVFLQTDGTSVSLNPGQTWIEVIDDPARVTIDEPVGQIEEPST